MPECPECGTPWGTQAAADACATDDATEARAAKYTPRRDPNLIRTRD